MSQEKKKEFKYNTPSHPFIPPIDFSYIPFGNFFVVKRIVERGIFYPTWVTGESGNGKTKMIEQACAYAGIPDELIQGVGYEKLVDNLNSFCEKNGAKHGRKFVRVNFTQETCEDDLFGHKTLVEGNVVNVVGPVTEAALEGAVLLADEFDAANVNRALTMQAVLEGRSFHIKSTNSHVKPAPGFTIFATSNTKGRGSHTGKYGGTSIMNEALLDRFPAMIEQTYPDFQQEGAILLRVIGLMADEYKGVVTESDIAQVKSWVECLCTWAKAQREGAAEDDSMITTRTLINIIRAYFIFNNRHLAIGMACSRYDADIKQDFLKAYAAVDSSFDISKFS